MQLQQYYESAERLGYKQLNPMQEKVISEGLLEAERALLCSPTASGKTLIALLAMLKNYQEKKRKSIYVVPLRALAHEKYLEFTEIFSQFEMKVGISTSDFDSAEEKLAFSDIIIVTIEKLDSLLRHNPAWLKNSSLAVIDEAHLLNDDYRGSTLEIVIVKLMQLQCNFLLLSATIANPEDITGWLHGKLFKSDYRPIKLVKAIATSGKIRYFDKKLKIEKQENKIPLQATLQKCFEKQGQAIVFVSTRRFAESAAAELSFLTNKILTNEEKISLEKASQKILKALPVPTSQCRTLASAVKNGIAFHHAGIHYKQREVIETAFKKERTLKTICATTTLAMGIDYPASYVIVRDLKRFSGGFSDYIPNFEIQQMLGRAGRPRYDNIGTGVLICKEADWEFVLDNYLLGSLEKIYSKLSSAAMLRMHTLGLIASGYCKSFKDIYTLFGNTLFAYQYKSTEELFQMLEDVIMELKEMDFVVEKHQKLVGTPIGKRVSELYLDPYTANFFIDFIKAKGTKQTFDYLFAINSATEMLPLLTVRKNEEQLLFEEVNSVDLNPLLEAQFADMNFVGKYKTSKMFNAWINEETEEKILKDFNVPPGILAGKVRNSVWLSYSMQELAFMLNQTTAYQTAKRLQKRLKQGIKEELLEVCKFKGIGRARGRKLFKAGIKTAEEFKATEKRKIKEIINS